MRTFIFALPFLMSGCAFISDVDESKRMDADNDGTIWIEDCDEKDAEISTTVWYEDLDGDGYGNPNSIIEDCDIPEGNWVDNQADCDDSNPSVFINAPEICDGIDNDCDEVVDDDDDNIEQSSQNKFLLDEDGDGFPQEGTTLWTCSESVENYILAEEETLPVDCDDSDPYISPADVDEDGFTTCDTESPDCDDLDPEKNPGEIDVCDGIDNNCDGVIDENLPATHYLDQDGDGYGDTTQSICVPSDSEAPENYVEDNTDCDDSLDVGSAIYPLAEEICDNVDNDCDTEIDENVQLVLFYDYDGDGYGSDSNTYIGCESPNDPQYISASGDCEDDTLDLDGDGVLDSSLINPDADERCFDFVDNDCNGLIDSVENNNWDEDLISSLGDGAPQLYYLDADADGYGTTLESGRIYSCFNPSAQTGLNYVTDEQSGDCDDSDSTIHPTLYEADGCYQDVDEDGYGDSFSDGFSSSSPGLLMMGTDCNDNDATVNPTKAEICDGQDNNCDEDLLESEIDSDGDGFVECEIDINGWDGPTSTEGQDCDDTPSTTSLDGSITDVGGTQTYPGAAENEFDTSICHADNDMDGYGDILASGDVLPGTDCDDNNALYYPNADERCDGLISSCSASLPANETDDDGDGFVECDIFEEGWQGIEFVLGGDCDDTPAEYDEDDNIIDVGGTQTYPGAAENEEELFGCVSDNDEDGFAPIEEGGLDCDDSDASYTPLENELDSSGCYLDIDGDGYGDYFASGSVNSGTDCDDSDPYTYPGVAENEPYPNYCYTDRDGDGYGSATPSSVDIAVGTDCNDTIGSGEFIHPLNNESDSSLCYEDFDEDGYGDSFVGTSIDDIPEGVEPGTDCNDGDNAYHPNALDICDGLNTSCRVSIFPYEVDDDGDGFVECLPLESGWQGEFFISDGGDCDDTPAEYDENDNIIDIGGTQTYPGAAENEEEVNYCFTDADGDGFAPLDEGGLDCDDDDSDINPSETEIPCDGIDNNCDGALEDVSSCVDQEVDGIK